MLFIPFPPTGPAEAINLQPVTLHLKPVFSSDIPLQFFDALILEFNDCAASRANKMIMMAVGCFVFITGETVLEPALFSHSRLCKEFQRPVYGGEADPGMGPFDQDIEFLCTDVSSRANECFQYLIALAGGFEPLPDKVR